MRATKNVYRGELRGSDPVGDWFTVFRSKTLTIFYCIICWTRIFTRKLMEHTSLCLYPRHVCDGLCHFTFSSVHYIFFNTWFYFASKYIHKFHTHLIVESMRVYVSGVCRSYYFHTKKINK